MSHSIEVYSSYYYLYADSYTTPEHTHNNVYQMFYCMEGEDFRTCREKSVVLRKGEFLLVPKGAEHGIKRCRGTTLDMKFDVFDPLLAEQLRLLSGRACRTDGAEYLFSQLVSLAQANSPFSLRLMALYLETAFCVLLDRILIPQRQQVGEEAGGDIANDLRRKSSVTRTLSSVEHFLINPDIPFSLDELSKEVGYSEKYFYREFKRETGISPGKYFNLLRIERAKQFLEFSDMKIAEIARILGYEGAQYFVKYFKKKVGLSPSNYRKQCRTALRKQIGLFENS